MPPVRIREAIQRQRLVSVINRLNCAEEALRRAEERIQEQAALLDATRDAILITDLQDHILYMNRSAERLYGWDLAEAATQDAHELLSATFPDRSLATRFSEPRDEACAALMEKGQWTGELRQVNKDGKAILVESRWTLVRDPDGRPKSKLIVNTDVTEKRRLEALFLRNQRLESIGALAGGIAHDLNNVLTPILMAVQLLGLKFTDSDSASLLKQLEACAERGGEMVKQILSFARGGESRRSVLYPQRVVTEIGKMLQRTLPKSIDIQAAVPKDLWLISADATQIYQMVMNLCLNARDAMPRGGQLTIGAENLVLDEHYARMQPDAKPGGYVRLTVADTGIGIPADLLDKVFEPFFTTKEQGQGTGLGLSTVLSIVKGHGGFITVQSEVGKGSRFAVCLPALKTGPSNSADLPEFELNVGNGELILVVDDEDAIRQITQQTLEAYGYRVVTARDGTEAVALYAQRREDIQVVLADLMMPVMDGTATIQVLQKLDPRVRVVAVSGLRLDGKAALAAAMGVRAFLPKPYTADKLLKTIRDTLTST